MKSLARASNDLRPVQRSAPAAPPPPAAPPAPWQAPVSARGRSRARTRTSSGGPGPGAGGSSPDGQLPPGFSPYIPGVIGYRGPGPEPKSQWSTDETPTPAA